MKHESSPSASLTLAAVFLCTAPATPPLAHAQWDHGTSVYLARIAGDPNFQSEWPSKIAADSSGRVYVVYNSILGDRIQKIIPGGSATFFTAGKFQSFRDIAVDPSGNVYALDGYLTGGSGAVRKYKPDGTAMTLTAGGFVPDSAWTATPATLPQVQAIAVDASGNIFLASTRNTILKVAPDGTVSTFAGKTDEFGSADGTASARFGVAAGLAVDRSGNVFVADSGNHTIRKITPDGVVSTVAGSAGNPPGGADGTGTAARLNTPYGIAVDDAGILYVIDHSGIRHITPGGVVTTPGLVSNIWFGEFQGIAVDPVGTIYVSDDWNAVVYMSVLPPAFTALPTSQTATPGATATFSAPATSNVLVTYQWQKDGVAIPGATNSTLIVSNVQTTDLGTYTVRATTEAGTVESNPAVLSLRAANTSGLLNLSIRSRAGTDAETLIVGFVISGTGTTGTKPLLVRGAGPALESFGVPGFLADPTLAVFSGATIVAANDSWGGDTSVASAAADVGAFAFAPSSSRDAALYHAGLGAGTYSVHVSGVGGTTGVTLAEIYDATPASAFTGATPRLINISARTHVGTGADVLIAGFNVGGTAARTLLIRAVGPTLSTFGVTGALTDPKLELFQGTSLLQANDNWNDDTQVSTIGTQVGAFALDGASLDAALLVTLPPGSYTAQVSGVANTTGVALVEIYEVP